MTPKWRAILAAFINVLIAALSGAYTALVTAAQVATEHGDRFGLEEQLYVLKLPLTLVGIAVAALIPLKAQRDPAIGEEMRKEREREP